MSDKILIIDDTPANLQVLGQNLKNSGYEVVAALNGKDGISVLGKSHFDLILLDVSMPDLDGYEVCKLLKKDVKSKQIPVIFLTARTEPSDILKGFEVGGVDYITKPFHVAELLARVKTHIELKEAREEILSLRGIIPICSSCKSIRNDEGYWERVESYLSKHSEMVFSHGLCPGCIKKIYPELADEILKGSDSA